MSNWNKIYNYICNKIYARTHTHSHALKHIHVHTYTYHNPSKNITIIKHLTVCLLRMKQGMKIIIIIKVVREKRRRRRKKNKLYINVFM